MGLTLDKMGLSVVHLSLSVALLVAFCCGMLSPFVLLRRRSLLADTMAHVALPGVGLSIIFGQHFAFELFASRLFPFYAPSYEGGENGGAILVGMLFGGAISCFCAFLFILFLQRSKLSIDGVFAIALTTFFGAGLMVFGIAARVTPGNSPGLARFLFGNLAVITEQEVLVFLALGVMVLLLVFVGFRGFKLLAIDEHALKALHFRVRAWRGGFDLLLLLVILLGLQIVGVVLMGAMLVGPAAIVKQWSNNFRQFFLLSIIVALFAAGLGVLVSARYAHLPPGPVIVLILAFLLAGSFLKNMAVKK